MTPVPGLMRLRALPWLLLFEAARTVQAHLTDALSPSERRRVAEILRSSRGNPQQVTPAEREELRRLAHKLDVGKLARDLVPAAVRARGGGRGRSRRFY